MKSREKLVQEQASLIKKLQNKKLEDWQVNKLNSECEVLEMEIAEAEAFDEAIKAIMIKHNCNEEDAVDYYDGIGEPIDPEEKHWNDLATHNERFTD